MALSYNGTQNSTKNMTAYGHSELSVIITKCRYAECSATCKGMFGGACYMLKRSHVHLVTRLSDVNRVPKTNSTLTNTLAYYKK